jgi:hypothetical protein
MQEVKSWEKAAVTAIDAVGEGDLLVLQPDMIDETVEFIGKYVDKGAGREVTIEEVLWGSHPDNPDGGKGSENVEVRPCSFGRGAYARKAFVRGDEILRVSGPRTTKRLRETIQIDHHEHMVPPSPLVFLNHCCDPNCGILIRKGVPEVTVKALRPIAEGEELTIDYATFEASVEHIEGACLCGARACRGVIGGYDTLPADRREAYGVHIAEYLRQTSSTVEKANKEREPVLNGRM